ncbi:energy transducer TonB, partial [Xanthomonas oryzae pv. oryzae]
VNAPAPTQTRVVTSRRGEQAVPTPQPNPQTDPLTPADAQRLQRDAEMARLAAEVHLRSEQYAKRPNRKFVSASTREYAYANYLRAWVDRAERVGNLNYPDDARRRRLGGKVVINVGVRRDGSVESSSVLVSSGVPLLDDAALRLVQLAQPFPPLPKTKDDVDILQVTRTWLFLPGGELHDDR